MILNLLFGGVAGAFLLMGIGALIQLRWARRLPAYSHQTSPPPFCSVVLAARNEEDRIEKTIRHLLEQIGVSVEIIAVDDRSSDRTGAILTKLAAEDPRIRVTRVDVLPDNWLGKCHGCHMGAGLARGEWILFTDADCWLGRDVLARALQAADREAADHVTVIPGFATESYATRAWYLLFLTSFLDWISGVNRDQPKAHLGIGAFNLVRASAYRKCGGYEALRLSVVDDIKLGLLLSRCQFRTRAFLGAEDAECHWGTTLRSVTRVLEKNYFAILDYRLVLVIAGTAFGSILFGTILTGLIVQTPLGIAAALSPFALSLPAAILARRMGWPLHCSFGVPFMLPVFLYALLNSTWVTLRHGGVRWRDTFYPLAQLRAGGVR